MFSRAKSLKASEGYANSYEQSRFISQNIFIYPAIYSFFAVSIANIWECWSLGLNSCFDKPEKERCLNSWFGVNTDRKKRIILCCTQDNCATYKIFSICIYSKSRKYETAAHGVFWKSCPEANHSNGHWAVTGRGPAFSKTCTFSYIAMDASSTPSVNILESFKAYQDIIIIS